MRPAPMPQVGSLDIPPAEIANVIPFSVPPNMHIQVRPGVYVWHTGPGPIAVRVVDKRPDVPLPPPPGLGERLLEALLTWRRDRRGARA